MTPSAPHPSLPVAAAKNWCKVLLVIRVSARKDLAIEKRNCPFCGKPVSPTLNRCPFCREAIPAVPVTSGSRGDSGAGRSNIRRGLLWALLAGVIHYFATGRSGFTLPFEVPGFVTLYLTPLLFLSGVAMALYGLFQKARA